MREEKRKIAKTSFPPKIIFEDKNILVIDKPPGVVVNRVETTKKETIQDWVKNYLKIKGKGVGDRAGIVHRLDKETSGVLIVAKSQKAFKVLQKQFKERRVEKRYLALVHGRVEPKEGVIEASIARSPFDRKKFGVFLGGRRSKSKYKVRNYSRDYTFLELRPTTGRTHQLRVHLKHIGHSVVSDEKYAGRKTARADRQWCPRQFLHASYLSFTHPQTEEKVKFTSPLPLELKKALRKVKILY